MIKWIRPSGLPIELADTENLNEFAKAQGWKKDEPEEPKVKRTRRTPAQMKADREALENGSDSGSSN
jgi:hypothetical protein